MAGYARTFAFVVILLGTLVSLSQSAIAPTRDNYPFSKVFMLHRRAGGMPNLSVVSPLDVLRQKMVLDMMEQKMRNKINANNEYLLRLGKRSDIDSTNSAAARMWLENLPSAEGEVIASPESA